jgi:hypothetical protein
MILFIKSYCQIRANLHTHTAADAAVFFGKTCGKITRFAEFIAHFYTLFRAYDSTQPASFALGIVYFYSGHYFAPP